MQADPRLFLENPLTEGAEIALEKDQAHYLVNVMRRKTGDTVRLFNGRDGEWRAEIAEAGKRAATLRLTGRTREQYDPPDLWLLFAPVKKARTDFIAEKATELGATKLQPVFTRFTNSERVRTDRLAALAKEAAEQTERLDLPEIAEPLTLDAALDGWDETRPLLYCDEAGDETDAPWGGDAGRADSALAVLHSLSSDQYITPPLPSRGGSDESACLRQPEKLAVLIGPEGGFSPAERARLRGLPYVFAVSLGPRILRTDSAVVAALTLVQAVWGDWRDFQETS